MIAAAIALRVRAEPDLSCSARLAVQLQHVGSAKPRPLSADRLLKELELFQASIPILTP
jgi:hypothetical protein